MFVLKNVKQEDCSCFVMRTVLTGAYAVKSMLFLKYNNYYCNFLLKKKFIFVKVVTVKKSGTVWYT